MSDPIRWGEASGKRPRAVQLLLRGAPRPRPPTADEMDRLAAAVDRIGWPLNRPLPRSGRLATAVVVCALVLGGGTVVWALRATWRQTSAPSDDGPISPPTGTRRITPQIIPLPPYSPAVTSTAVSPGKATRRRHAVASAGRPLAVREEPAAPAGVRPSEGDTLPLELALIDQARADVDTYPARALATLDRHRDAFPGGQMAAEREFLAVEALRRLNRLDEAQRRAAELRRTYPSSSYAARATRLLSPRR